MSTRDAIQELRELGPGGTLFRVSWELRTRTGLTTLIQHAPPRWRNSPGEAALEWTARLPMADPITVAACMRERLGRAQLDDLRLSADAAARGTVLCFGRWPAEFGDPIDWQRNPRGAKRWDSTKSWARSLLDETEIGDVKLTWEVARFPHAYVIARAAAFHPEHSDRWAEALLRQIESFRSENPVGRGIHWASGQETAFRLLAWLFALDAHLVRGPHGARAAAAVGEALCEGASHVERHIDYARIAVYNNHLLSEALLLYAAGVLLPALEAARRWRRIGRALLEEQAQRQFYADGAYIQLSHNYHRVALQDLLWASVLARADGDSMAPAWREALERSLDFLHAHQCPTDGRLPNYGSNDGALPSIFSSSDFSDYRPVLQCVSLMVRGERLYEPGPWDETAAWVIGPLALEAPLRPRPRRSASFKPTGFHVLRGNDERSFAAFRCGSIRDRFSQIDMLHLDVWWRGQNVLVDGGSYLYNGPAEWHEHFMRTASHNTVVVDGRDQMLHYRRFKCLYWTKARLLAFEDRGDSALVSGEHYGYRRHPGECVHRRSVLHVKDDLWVVVDQIDGRGEHVARLHWLGGEFPHEELRPGAMRLLTPEGPFEIAVFDEKGHPLAGDVVRGSESALRGWLSRYYGEKVPVPSLAVERRGRTPLVFVSVLSADTARCSVEHERWQISAGAEVSLAIEGGLVAQVQVGHP